MLTFFVGLAVGVVGCVMVQYYIMKLLADI